MNSVRNDTPQPACGCLVSARTAQASLSEVCLESEPAQSGLPAFAQEVPLRRRRGTGVRKISALQKV